MGKISDISLKIKQVRELSKQTLSLFARNLDIPRSTLVSYENGVNVPAELLIKISERFGVSEQWLLSDTGPIYKELEQGILPTGAKTLHKKANIVATGTVPITKSQKGQNDSKFPSKEAQKGLGEEANKSAFSLGNSAEKSREIGSPSLPDTPGEGAVETTRKEALVVVDGGVEQGVLIPVIGQGASAGFGFDYEEGEIIRYVKIPSWIARQSRDLVAMPIYSDSMEPTLSSGDLAVCSTAGFCGDGVYIVRDSERGLTFCKRVIWTPGGWTIVSDNPRYEPMKVEDRAIEIVARVIAAVKEVK